MCLITVFAIESGEEEDDVEQITVKFARTETERSKQAREKSFSHLQKKNAEESFIQTKFYASGTRESKVTINLELVN